MIVQRCNDLLSLGVWEQVNLALDVTSVESLDDSTFREIRCLIGRVQLPLPLDLKPGMDFEVIGPGIQATLTLLDRSGRVRSSGAYQYDRSVAEVPQ